MLFGYSVKVVDCSGIFDRSSKLGQYGDFYSVRYVAIASKDFGKVQCAERAPAEIVREGETPLAWHGSDADAELGVGK